MIANDISLKNFTTYTHSVYDIEGKFNSLERKNENIGRGRNTKTKASTCAKMMFMSCVCFEQSINELVTTTHDKTTCLYNFFDNKEYIPKTHGLRDCIIDTDYNQLCDINDFVINKAKENKFFRKNTVDGLVVVAWDGVETHETKKDILNLPEREHKDNDIKKYIKYLMAMNIGEKANIFIAEKQMTETEKVLTKSGEKKAKTFGETTAFINMVPIVERKLGNIIDVNVFDALFLNSNVMNTINDTEKYFVIRMEDKTKNIYKDAKGLFKNTKPIKEYEIVEITYKIKVKYNKEAKHKDYEKTKTKIITRKITESKLNKSVVIDTKIQQMKNSTKTTTISEKVKRRVKVWDDKGFDYAKYKGQLRVIKTEETYIKDGKEVTNEIYIATNMLEHPAETIIKIMHLRWNIENNGFRKIKQNFNFEHIFIGEFNSINYIVQMIILVYNLLELYFRVRLKEKIKTTYIQLKKKFETQIKEVGKRGEYFKNDS